MRYLTSVVETYRLPNDEAVKVFLEELKRDPAFTITKYSSTKKERKEKRKVVIAASTNGKQQDKIVYTASGAWLWWGSGLSDSPTALLDQMLCV